MLKEFWEVKKYLIQMVGSLVTIGALFLNIPQTSDKNTNLILMNIQFFWILLIIFCLTCLLYSLLQFIVHFEKQTRNNRKIDFDYTLSTGFFILSLILLFNLIRYTVLVYFSHIDPVTLAVIIHTIVGVFFTFMILFLKRFFEKYNLNIVARYLIASLVPGIAISTIGLFLNKIKDGYTFVFILSVGVLVVFLLFILSHFKK